MAAQAARREPTIRELPSATPWELDRLYPPAAGAERIHKRMHPEEIVERVLRKLQENPNLAIQHFARALPPPQPINK